MVLKHFISVKYLHDTLEVDKRLDFVASLVSRPFCLLPLLPSFKLQCAEWDSPISFRETKFVLKDINRIIETICQGYLLKYDIRFFLEISKYFDKTDLWWLCLLALDLLWEKFVRKFVFPPRDFAAARVLCSPE